MTRTYRKSVFSLDTGEIVGVSNPTVNSKISEDLDLKLVDSKFPNAIIEVIDDSGISAEELGNFFTSDLGYNYAKVEKLFECEYDIDKQKCVGL